MDSGVFIYKAGRTNRNSMNFVIICGSAEGRPPAADNEISFRRISQRPQWPKGQSAEWD